mmetsp:Transcript_34286/g.85415  ORF Transcript_34286/g.85415 Transcript_34286/m.85415 type:complete len:323 (-) Transcript_34286:141-1109(-)
MNVVLSVRHAQSTCFVANRRNPVWPRMSSYGLVTRAGAPLEATGLQSPFSTRSRFPAGFPSPSAPSEPDVAAVSPASATSPSASATSRSSGPTSGVGRAAGLTLATIAASASLPAWLSRTSCVRVMTSIVSALVKPTEGSTSSVRATCSMHGEKQHSLPPGLTSGAAITTASHGCGRSKITASIDCGAMPSYVEPRTHASPWRQLTREASPFASNSLAAAAARFSLNSYVKRCPRSPTQRARLWESAPEPVPASITRQPGRSSSCRQIIEMSAMYRICVRCCSDAVHSSGVGGRRKTNPFPLREARRAPKGFPTIEECGNAP